MREIFREFGKEVKMSRVIPTIFARNKKEFRKRFRKLIKLNRGLQIDFMDGKFVKTRGINVNDVPNLKKYKNKFEAHLMCVEPAKYVRELRKKGFRKVIFHYEALDNKDKALGLVYYIRAMGMKAWIAINPNTDFNMLKDILYYIDGVLIMGVHPGRENQKFNNNVFKKIGMLRKFNRKIMIQVDGGVNLDNVSKLKRMGTNFINSGNFVYNSENPEVAVKELERAFK